MKITEDKIRGALNESLNEFMLEEGLGNSMLGKLGKGIWNGLKMYMDWRTNGQWNSKYGMYANGNGKVVLLRYFAKWLKSNHDCLQNLSGAGQIKSPMDMYNKNNRAKRFKGDPRFDPEAYLYNICTPTMFLRWIRQYNRDVTNESIAAFSDYISKYIVSQHKIEDALYYLNIYAFYETPEGKQYIRFGK